MDGEMNAGSGNTVEVLGDIGVMSVSGAAPLLICLQQMAGRQTEGLIERYAP